MSLASYQGWPHSLSYCVIDNFSKKKKKDAGKHLCTREGEPPTAGTPDHQRLCLWLLFIHLFFFSFTDFRWFQTDVQKQIHEISASSALYSVDVPWIPSKIKSSRAVISRITDMKYIIVNNYNDTFTSSLQNRYKNSTVIIFLELSLHVWKKISVQMTQWFEFLSKFSLTCLFKRQWNKKMKNPWNERNTYYTS